MICPVKNVGKDKPCEGGERGVVISSIVGFSACSTQPTQINLWDGKIYFSDCDVRHIQQKHILIIYCHSIM